MKQQKAKSSRKQGMFCKHLDCGACPECLQWAVIDVYTADTPKPEHCSHLWAVLSACVDDMGWMATHITFKHVATSLFPADYAAIVCESIAPIMSKLRSRKAVLRVHGCCQCFRMPAHQSR